MPPTIALDKPLAVDFAPSELRTACERILASPGFARAPRMTRLLRFLVDQAVQGNARATTEYAIGLDVFDRDASSYSPGEDPVVRVQVGRLRARQQSYYAVHGEPGVPRLLIPLGSYRPVLRKDASPQAAAVPTSPPWADCDDGVLLLPPVRMARDGAEGLAFALGLHDELVSRVVESIGPVAVCEALSDSRSADARNPRPRTLVSSLRVDAQWLRASVRLLEAPLNRVRWVQQFDRAPSLGIGEQEELAYAICQALRQHLDR